MDKKFISSEQNDYFANLGEIDLQELLVQTENYFLQYRDKLNLPEDVTFGTELEYEDISKNDTDVFLKNHLNSWTSEIDNSLKSGGEIVSPILHDSIECWKELKIVCDYLSGAKANTLDRAGGHIHIGAHILGSNVHAWKNFLKLYMTYENILFRFAYGDKISGRERLKAYAFPIADTLYKKLATIDKAYNMSRMFSCLASIDGRFALNLHHVDFDNPNKVNNENTLEFRFPNASTSAVIWQNNINTFAKMLVSARDNVMDVEFLDYKLKHEFVPYEGNEYRYNEVCLKNALEFVDLVFDNNLDKVYFLRQYFKNFQDNYGLKVAVPAEPFVK